MPATITKRLVTLQRVTGSNAADIFYPKTVAGQVYINAEETATLADHIADSNLHITATERGYLTNARTANGVAILDANGFVPVSNLNPSVLAITKEFADVAAMLTDAGASVEAGQLVMVIDASTDPTVTSGWAIYRKRTGTGIDYTQLAGWQKIAESESLDVTVTWDNIQGKPSSTPAQIDQAVTDDHTHANKATLDLITYDTANSRLMYNGTEQIAFMSQVPAVDVQPSTATIDYSNYKTGDLIFVYDAT